MKALDALARLRELLEVACCSGVPEESDVAEGRCMDAMPALLECAEALAAVYPFVEAHPVKSRARAALARLEANGHE